MSVSSLRYARGVLFSMALVISPLVFSFAFTSFLHPKEAVLGLALCATALLKGLENASEERKSPYGLLWLWLLAALLPSVLGGNGIVPAYTAEEGFRLALVLLLATLNWDLLLLKPWQNVLPYAIATGAASAALLALLQYGGALQALLPRFPNYSQAVYSVFGNQDLLGGYLALAITVLFSLHGENLPPAARSHRILIAIAHSTFAGLSGAALVLSGSRSAWLAAALGLLPFLLPHQRALYRAKINLTGANAWSLFLLLALSIASLATVALTFHDTTRRITNTFTAADIGGRARLWFWDAALRMFAAHPIFGVGLGNFQYWSPWFEGEVLHGSLSYFHYHNELHTLRAHSLPLDVLAETGLVGVVCLSGLFLQIRPRHNKWTGPFIAWCTFALFNSVLESMPHVLVGLLLLALLSERNPNPVPPVSPLRPNRALRALGLSLIAAVLVLGYAGTILVPSAARARAEEAHLRGEDPSAFYQRALEWPWPQYSTAESYGVWLLDQQEFEKARYILGRAKHGLDTGRIYYLLAIAALGNGHQEEARRWLEEARWRWPGNQKVEALLSSAR